MCCIASKKEEKKEKRRSLIAGVLERAEYRRRSFLSPVWSECIKRYGCSIEIFMAFKRCRRDLNFGPSFLLQYTEYGERSMYKIYTVFLCSASYRYYWEDIRESEAGIE